MYTHSNQKITEDTLLAQHGGVFGVKIFSHKHFLENFSKKPHKIISKRAKMDTRTSDS